MDYLEKGTAVQESNDWPSFHQLLRDYDNASGPLAPGMCSSEMGGRTRVSWSAKREEKIWPRGTATMMVTIWGPADEKKMDSGSTYSTTGGREVVRIISAITSRRWG